MAKLISSPGILILLPISSPVNVITVCSLNETFPVTSTPASIYSFPFSSGVRKNIRLFYSKLTYYRMKSLALELSD